MGCGNRSGVLCRSIEDRRTGLGIMVVPLMVLTVGDARKSAGWLLPMLCMADVFALYYWRRHASAGRLFGLAPWVVAGCVGGAFALSLPEKQIRPLVGGIVLLMLLAYLKRRISQSRSSTEVVDVAGAPYGVAAGFATTVANAAGPVMSLYLLSKRLPKEEFVATGAWFFFFVNLSKVPIYTYHGSFSATSLLFDALMFPAVLADAYRPMDYQQDSGESVRSDGGHPDCCFHSTVIPLTTGNSLQPDCRGLSS